MMVWNGIGKIGHDQASTTKGAISKQDGKVEMMIARISLRIKIELAYINQI